MSDYQYPLDEFDELSLDFPSGAHRKPRSPWTRPLILLAVIVLVPLLAWGTVMWLGSSGQLDKIKSATGVSTTASAEPTPSQTSTDEAVGTTVELSQTPTPTPTTDAASPSASPSTEAAVPAEADKAATIIVYNGTNISRFAAKAQQKLITDGFTRTSATNWRGAQPTATTVYYKSEEDKATAQYVAQVLGIDTVEESATQTGNAKVIAVLRSDYR